MRLLLPLVLVFTAPAGAEGCAAAFFGELKALREILKPLARVDTAYDRDAYLAARAAGGYALTEHCGCVATVVRSVYGGRVFLGVYTAPDGRGVWHVFNRLEYAGAAYDVDLTKAQFGFAEDADDLRPPTLSNVTELSHAELAANDRLQTFLRRYRMCWESMRDQLQSNNSPR